MIKNEVTWLKATIEIVMYGTEDRLVALVQDFQQDYGVDIAVNTISIKEMEEVNTDE